MRAIKIAELFAEAKLSEWKHNKKNANTNHKDTALNA